MNSLSHPVATTRRSQDRRDRGDIDFFPPTSARLVAVAAGLEQWTAREQAWLAVHPRWLGFAQMFSDAFEQDRPPPNPKFDDLIFSDGI